LELALSHYIKIYKPNELKKALKIEYLLGTSIFLIL